MNTVEAPVPSFERHCAERLREQRDALVRAWIEQIVTGTLRRPRPLMQTRALPDTMPAVLGEVADFLCADEERILTARPELAERLVQFAALCYAEGIEAQELVCEFEVLARVLDGACLEWLADYPAAPEPRAVVRAAGRLNRAAILLAEVAIGAYRDHEMRARELEADRVRAFVTNLAHELKMPLSAAETAALMLEDNEISSSSRERRRLAGVVQRGLRRARNLIDDVSALALAEAAERDPPARKLPVGLVLANVMAEIRDVAEAAGVRVDVVEPVPDIRVDAARVELILVNLIDNAAKYSDTTQSRRWVRVGFRRDPADQALWWISVTDNGLGIAAELRPRVFERFFRAHPERSEGTGLGLAMVHEAAVQLGAQLQVESEPGVGSTFRFSLRVE